MAWEIGSLFLIIAAVAAMIYGGMTLTLNQMNKRFDELKSENEALETRLRSEIQASETRLRSEIQASETRLRNETEGIGNPSSEMPIEGAEKPNCKADIQAARRQN